MSNDKDNIGEQNEVKINSILLCFFLGSLGIHRFYLGYTLIGVIQLPTFGGFLIWVIVDLIRLIIGSLKDSEDNDLA
ncbi:MAG: hypothetical protein CM1200mP28_09000 [Deltaproteobacteria bacterium]|nr:MAG: hypothetical protein CM1200mP28_09000 [Deltaproteobacteria bacterium]